MNSAVRSLQKNLFVILLYASAFIGVLTDLFMGGSKTAFYAIYDAIIVLLCLFSLSYASSGLRTIILVILAAIILNFSYSSASLYASVNGIREIIVVLALTVFYSKVFADGNEEEAEEYVQIMKKFTVYFLLAQLPAAGIQFAMYGPTDYVGGTYGNLNGGALTLVIICLVFFMFQFKTTFVQKLFLFVSLIPLFLNETKVSFILIPLMVVFIYFQPKLKNILLAAVGGIAFLFIFNSLYSHSALAFDDNVSGIFSADFLEDYLFADIYTYEDVPRFTKIILGWQLLSQETNTMLFGFEYGVFRVTNLSDASPFAQNYQWLLSGTRPYLFYLMIQGGVFLIGGFLMLMARINNYFRDTNKFVVFYFLLFLILIFYLDSFRHQHFSIVYFFMVFYGNSTLFKNKIAAE